MSFMKRRNSADDAVLMFFMKMSKFHRNHLYKYVLKLFIDIYIDNYLFIDVSIDISVPLKLYFL